MAVDFTTGIWVEAVATVEVCVVEFTGGVGVGVVSIGWASTLTLYLLFGEHGFLLLSFLGLGALLVKGLVFWGGALVLGCSGVGHG